MPNPSDEFDALLQRARAGCPDAARQLYDQYADHLRRIIRRRLSGPLRRVFDSTDFLQETWKDFYAKALDKRFACPGQLLAFLASMAEVRLLQAQRRYLDSAKRDLRRQQPLEDSDADREQGPVTHQQTPDQIASARDECDHLLHGLAPEYQQALLMLRDGYTYQEIAELLGLNEKTVRRLLERLRHKYPA
jgi:RNA polymerase sigma-70 factor (ECF subfamily)